MKRICFFVCLLIVSADVAVDAADALIWTPGSGGQNSGAAIVSALTDNGRSSQTASDIKSLSLNSFSTIFICLGVSPNNYVLKSDVNSTEIANLTTYLNSGGRLYMEGGDTWARDFPTSLHAKFYVYGEGDGGNDLSTVAGASCMEGYQFSYSGVKNYIDRIAPKEGAALFFTNTLPAYGCGVAYDNGVYRTVGVSFEFGGLTDGGSTKNALMSELLSFFSSGCSLGKPAPAALQAFSGYDHAVPLMWETPPGQSSLSMDEGKRPSLVFKQQANTQKPPQQKLADQRMAENTPAITITAYQTNSFNVYRAASADGPFSKIASNVERQFYQDTSASDGVTYYYAVTSVYSNGESPRSLVASGTPAANGFVVTSPWARAVPTLDGQIDSAEWASARAIDIRNTGESGEVKLYVMNRTDYLYLAVDETGNSSLAADDQVGIHIDQNRNGEWSYSLPYEGTFWAYWSGSAMTHLYRALSGWWPISIEWKEPVTSSRMTSAAATASGHVQYEMRYDLSALTMTPPDYPLNLFLYTLDQPDSLYRAAWPPAVLNTVWNDAWLAPVLYGTLRLSSEESCDQLSETQTVDALGSFIFHSPGDGHQVAVAVTSLSGSGDMTVTQSNCPYSDLPGAHELPMYWTISVDGIAGFSADLTFSYTDADAAGFSESGAFWGMAWYNAASTTWNWVGGAVDAVNNTVTLSGVAAAGDYVMFRRIFGDASGDGYVDLDDFQRLGDVWNLTSAGEFSEGSDAAFFNCGKSASDGKQTIDLDDFQVFGDAWNNGVKP